MNCSACQPLLVDYVHHELDAATDAAVYSHIKTCASCASQYQHEVQLGETLRRAFADELDMPTSVLAGVRLAMHGQATESPSFAERIRALLRPRLAIPLAAVIAVLTVGVVRVGQYAQPQPSFSTGYYLREHVAQTMGSPVSDRAWSEYVLTSANDNAQSQP
ncbi:MAG TPA: zf-HC2 domain-containing protein [Candidatus Eremiobacteraceae bacterium]|nr:zf-HC2 domain-containing protein [Candidatus Eremiobacteraceae bacterium]